MNWGKYNPISNKYWSLKEKYSKKYFDWIEHNDSFLPNLFYNITWTLIEIKYIWKDVVDLRYLSKIPNELRSIIFFPFTFVRELFYVTMFSLRDTFFFLMEVLTSIKNFPKRFYFEVQVAVKHQNFVRRKLFGRGLRWYFLYFLPPFYLFYSASYEAQYHHYLDPKNEFWVQIWERGTQIIGVTAALFTLCWVLSLYFVNIRYYFKSNWLGAVMHTLLLVDLLLPEYFYVITDQITNYYLYTSYFILAIINTGWSEWQEDLELIELQETRDGKRLENADDIGILWIPKYFWQTDHFFYLSKEETDPVEKDRLLMEYRKWIIREREAISFMML